MNPDVDTSLAVELPTQEQIATDLSAEAMHDRVRRAKIVAATEWCRRMDRAFRGITGAPTRPQRVQLALDKFGLRDA